MKQVIRQGDVYIVLNQDMPNGLKERKDKTLALGEATGHHHTFVDTAEVAVFGELGGQQWIVVDDEAELTHQEHNTLIIPPGVHEVRIQREYHPEEIRRVID